MSNKIVSAVAKVAKITGAPLISEFKLDVASFSQMEIADIEKSLSYHIDLVKSKREEWLIDYCAEEKTIEVEKDPDEQETTEEKKITKKVGLSLPVGLFHQRLKKYAEGASEEAAVYMTAVLEYLTAEVLELAGNACRGKKRSRILPCHIETAVRGDDQLDKLMENFSFAIDLPTKTTNEEVSAEEEPEKEEPVKPEKISAKAEDIEIYLLFDATQFSNSSDTSHELDYAFAGAFRSKEDALAEFANRLLEKETEGVEERTFFDSDGKLLPEVNEGVLEDYGWKLMVKTLH